MKSKSADNGDSDSSASSSSSSSSSARRFGHAHHSHTNSGRSHHMKSSLSAAAAAAAVAAASSFASGHHHSSSSEHEDSNSPPMSPLRLPQLSSSSSSISSWPFCDHNRASHSSQSSEDGDSQPALCNSNSKEDRSSYNTKFARYHLETYRRNDQMRWNFDFDHNRPLDEQHHHHHQTAARYQWEPAI